MAAVDLGYGVGGPRLERAASCLAEAGRLGIFTPMYFFLARKPE